MCGFTMSFSVNTELCLIRMFDCLFCRVYYKYREQKEVTEMKVGLNEALQNYLQDKGHKHLVLKAKICHS